VRKTIDIDQVTYDDLRAGRYEEELPELYSLKNTVEHILPFHDRQSVFDHTLGVFLAMKELLTLDFVADEKRKDEIKKLLCEKVGRFTRRELLLQLALLHDIAKGVTARALPDGSRVCPKHDEVGAEMMKNFKDRFRWSDADLCFVESMVRKHLTINDMVDAVWRSGDDVKKADAIERIKKFTGGTYVEELLFMWADTSGLDLKRLDKKYFDLRAGVCKELILRGRKA